MVEPVYTTQLEFRASWLNEPLNRIGFNTYLCKPPRSNNMIVSALFKMWKKYYHICYPGQSLVASFLWHPKFQVAVEMFNVGWIKVWLGPNNLESGKVFPSFSYRYTQVQNSVRSLMGQYDFKKVKTRFISHVEL